MPQGPGGAQHARTVSHSREPMAPGDSTLHTCPDLSSSPPAPQGTPGFAAYFRCVLLDSRPACKEDHAMDPLRFPGTPHPSAPD